MTISFEYDEWHMYFLNTLSLHSLGLSYELIRKYVRNNCKKCRCCMQSPESAFAYSAAVAPRTQSKIIKSQYIKPSI